MEVFEHPLIKHKEAGSNVEEVKVNNYCRDILIKLQAFITKYSINWTVIRNKHHKEQVDLELFIRIVREIDQAITTY